MLVFFLSQLPRTFLVEELFRIYDLCAPDTEVVLMLIQIVYDANKLSKLVEEKKKTQNWLDFYQLKYSRNQTNRATVKV